MNQVDYDAQLNSFDKAEIWEQIHERGLKEFSQRKRKSEARKLEQFLRNLKLTLSKTPATSIGGYIGTQLLENNSPVSQEGRKLLQYENSAKRYGKEFEEDITKIFNEILGAELAINIGEKTATTDTILSQLDIQKIYKNSNINQLLKRGVIKLIEGTADQTPLYKLGQKQGKIDVSVGSSTVQLEATESSSLQQVRSIIAGSNFSLKNYAGRTIHLGNTSLIRVYTAILPKLMPEYSQEQIKFFYKKTTGGRQSPTTQLHKAHLRFMYELSGLGLICEGERTNLKSVDFLIINEKQGPNIYVYSVGELIEEYLNSKNPKKTMSITVTSPSE